MNAPESPSRSAIRIVGTCQTDGGTFLIRSPYNPSHVPFFKMLPNSTFLKAKTAWKCDATPYAAAKLLAVGLSADDQVKYLAERWEEGQLPPKVGELTNLLLQFKTRPWAHQQRAMAYSINKPSSLLAMEMGCLGGDTMIDVRMPDSRIGRRHGRATISFITSLYLDGIYSEHNPIETLSYDGEGFVWNPIRNAIPSGNKKTIRLHAGSVEGLECTEDHLIRVADKREWVEAGKLRVGDMLIRKEGKWRLGLIEDAGVQDTYDLVMTDPHRNFIANGLVVHNCGKTLTTICLLQAWQSRLTLILCPKSVTGVWRREFAKHCGLSHQVTILEGTSKEKAYQAQQAKLRARSYAISAIVINYESSWREHVGDVLQDTMWDCVVADESHRIKAMDSNQSKFAASLSTVSKRRLALTGTVMPNGEPIEVLAQYRFLEPALFGTTKSRFQEKFCNMSTKVPGKVDSYKNQDEFTSIFSKIAFRVQAKDVLTLPECLHVTIPVSLDKKTRDFYEKMKTQALLELETGDVTAKNAAIKVMRLHQIACGHSRTEEGLTVRLGKDKQEVLEDMISDIPKNEPVVVFCLFKEDLKQIEEVAIRLGRVYGEISGARKDITSEATMPEHIQLMGVQQRAGGTGIDLTRSRYAFWFSAGSSWGEFDQTNARLHRPGQKHNVTIYHLAATNTVDIKIYRSLRNKQDIGLELLKSIDHKDEDE